MGGDLWPLNDMWNYHCTASASAMNTLDRLQQVVSGRYGEPTGLDDFLPKADVQIKSRDYKDGILTLTLVNNSDCVAFFIRLSAKNAAGELIVPAFWSDNYVSIPPRAELQITCALPEPPHSLTLSGWNL